MIILLGMGLFSAFPFKIRERFFKPTLYLPLFGLPVFILLVAASMNEPSYVKATAAGALTLCIISVIVKWVLMIILRRTAPKKYRDTYIIRERHIQVALLLPSLVISIFISLSLI